MRRLLSIGFALAMMLAFVPGAGASTAAGLTISVDRAPVGPDGTTAGAVTDFILTFADRDPAVSGLNLKTGGTVTVTLPDGFVNTADGSLNALVLLQGWPQSPPAGPPGFLWTTTVSGNTITATLTADFLVGDTGPGFKQVHLLLNEFRNPDAGRYNIGLEIQPDPASGDTYAGTARARIIPEARPSANIVSVFSGGAPVPLNNPIYQTVAAGDDSLDVGMYLWEAGSSVAEGIVNPFLGVDIAMISATRGLLVQDGARVGYVHIDAPPGADDFGLSTMGPSTLGISAVTSLDVGILIATLHTDPDVTGDYTITFRVDHGNTQQVFVTTE